MAKPSSDRRGTVRIPGEPWERFNAWLESNAPGLTKEHIWGSLADLIVELDDTTAFMAMVKMGEPEDRAAFAQLALERLAAKAIARPVPSSQASRRLRTPTLVRDEETPPDTLPQKNRRAAKKGPKKH